MLNNVNEAISNYQKSIKLNPSKPESHYNLGNAFCIKQDFKNAASAYEKTLALDERNALAFYNLGNAYYMMNQPK